VNDLDLGGNNFSQRQLGSDYMGGRYILNIERDCENIAEKLHESSESFFKKTFFSPAKCVILPV